MRLCSAANSLDALFFATKVSIRLQLVPALQGNTKVFHPGRTSGSLQIKRTIRKRYAAHVSLIGTVIDVAIKRIASLLDPRRGHFGRIAALDA
jgi:hypothetical protein